jgi:hypothetical protein
MHIVTPTEIAADQVAWEGALEPLGETFGPGLPPSYGLLEGAPRRPRVTLGKPVCWSAEDAMESETGKPWSPPAGDHRYTLLRLACTLHPPGEPRSHYSKATLGAYLRPRSAGAGAVVAHDLYPRRLTAEEKGTFKIGLGPDLKFAGVLDISLLEVGAEIEFPQVFPVVQGYGLGESHAYWQFAHHSGHPLLGCQSVYAVLDAPGEAGGVRLTVELVATLETRFGPLRLGLPEEACVSLSRTIGA